MQDIVIIVLSIAIIIVSLVIILTKPSNNASGNNVDASMTNNVIEQINNKNKLLDNLTSKNRHTSIDISNKLKIIDENSKRIDKTINKLQSRWVLLPFFTDNTAVKLSTVSSSNINDCETHCNTYRDGINRKCDMYEYNTDNKNCDLWNYNSDITDINHDIKNLTDHGVIGTTMWTVDNSIYSSDDNKYTLHDLIGCNLNRWEGSIQDTNDLYKNGTESCLVKYIT